MNTHICFLFLLVIGLSVQKSEFEIDFRAMVQTVKLKDDKTLLDCTEKCDEVKEDECKCRRFTCPVNMPFFPCIKNGLQDLKLTQIDKFMMKLTKLNINDGDKRTVTDQKLAKDISPKVFLDYILSLWQEANAKTNG